MMNASLLLILLVLGDTPTERPRHPLAPSLPLPTKEEEKRYDDVIERFIQYDIGKLPGPAGKKALADFTALGPEAFFSLLDGFNRAANLEASCPAVIIGRKIASILRTTQDPHLLMFARENIGAGVTAKRHRTTIKDLQVACILRRGELQRRGLAARLSPTTTSKSPATMTLTELTTAVEKAKGPQLRLLLTEVEKRNGPQPLLLLATAAANKEEDVSKLGQSLLLTHLQRQPPDRLKELLRHDRAEVRATTAHVVGTRNLRYGAELIALLEDADPAVQQAARHALVRLARGVDHGPNPDASFGDRANAVRRWREWWAAQSGR